LFIKIFMLDLLCCGHNLVVKYGLAKTEMGVRFPLAAHYFCAIIYLCSRGEMDIMYAFEAFVGGSSPSGSA
jgi:hypothetical protein